MGGARRFMGVGLLRAGQADGKPIAFVGPGRLWRKSGFGEHRLGLAGGVFVAVFRVDALAFAEGHFQID